MVTDQVVADVLVWAVVFGFGSIFSWLVFLTIRHYQYGKPAYEALAGGELDDGHLQSTDERFEEIEGSHTDLRIRVRSVEDKVDRVDDKTDRNYELLKKVADKADVDGLLFGGTNSTKKGEDD